MPQEEKDSPWNPVDNAKAPVVVAVIDSGVDHSHPELAGKLWINQDEIPGNGKDDDQNGYIDDVIMPRDTRCFINRSLDLLENKIVVRPDRKYSNINL